MPIKGKLKAYTESPAFHEHFRPLRDQIRTNLNKQNLNLLINIEYGT